MSDKHPNPHQQQAPVHDSEEAQPGLDSLAPDDREWRPTPKPTAPGVEPTAPGSLKAPDTHNSKLDSLQPETLHNVMWAMSDRGIPRSYRTMEGFGIHTFRLINA